MRTIYIITNGTVLRRIGRRLVLEKGKDKLFEVPLKDVGRILIYGRTEVTGQTLTGLLDHEIPLFYLRRSGRLRGKLAPAIGNQVRFRQMQHRFALNNAFALPFARKLIDTKITNMSVVVRYLLHNSRGTSEACHPFIRACENLNNCNTREEIMGTEGMATRHYFQIYGSSLPQPFQFQLRSRRPAADSANALLNLGYMTVLREIISHIEAHHLDPYLGVLHTTQDARPSLALDLLEEFRQPLIDLFLVKLLRQGKILPEHFRCQDQAVEISDDGFKQFFQAYEENMGKIDGDAPGLRKIIDDQIVLFKKFIAGEQPYRHFELTISEEEND